MLFLIYILIPSCLDFLVYCKLPIFISIIKSSSWCGKNFRDNLSMDERHFREVALLYVFASFCNPMGSNKRHITNCASDGACSIHRFLKTPFIQVTNFIISPGTLSRGRKVQEERYEKLNNKTWRKMRELNSFQEYLISSFILF